MASFASTALFCPVAALHPVNFPFPRGLFTLRLPLPTAQVRRDSVWDSELVIGILYNTSHV